MDNEPNTDLSEDPFSDDEDDAAVNNAYIFFDSCLRLFVTVQE